MSNYVTACCLGQQIVIIEGLKEVLKELKAIGNNLNQLVTLAHMGKITVINLTEVRQLLTDILIAVREIAERKRW
nr:plasmid mobilization relaxosome protein MobC [Lawsonibacter celer]